MQQRFLKRCFSSRNTSGVGSLYNTVLDTIGNTPCFKVNNLAPENVNLYVKAEYFNPASSVKDRLAISIIEEAERNGTPTGTLILLFAVSPSKSYHP